MNPDLVEALVLRKSLRVEVPHEPAGDGASAARQFDAVLMQAGFKCSRRLMERLSRVSAGAVIDTALRVLPVVREMTGGHVQHNTYFRDFPAGVPDTLEFWTQCLAEAMLEPVSAAGVEAGTFRTPGGTAFGLNLLSLPSYGRYLHTYEEMLAAHDDLIRSAGDRVTVLHDGVSLDHDARRLYYELASRETPLSEDDLAALRMLAEFCVTAEEPSFIPVRENRAVINEVRLAHGLPLVAIDTVTDVLRLACGASGGDVTLREPTRFRPFRRCERRTLLAALDKVVEASPAKLGDVTAYREPWKRLGERLHPHDYPQYDFAQRVFRVARGEYQASSIPGLVEVHMRGRRPWAAAEVLRAAPGRLFRSLDWLLRVCDADGNTAGILKAAQDTAPQASGRVLLSVREHFQNRHVKTDISRIFTNRDGRAWVTGDHQDVFSQGLIADVLAILDTEIASRIKIRGHLVIDPAVLGVALPLSGKAEGHGLGIMPRGSVSDVTGDLLRFFIYWKQAAKRTDYDLSALLLDGSYTGAQQLSYTNLRLGGGAHSGDITSAPAGASEFIDLQLDAIPSRFIIPQVNIYSGEAFNEAEEAFFGFMTRDGAQRGQPFEAATVRMKSDLSGRGRVALPLAFMRGDDGRWRAKWLHLYLRGHADFNQVEGNKVTTSLLTRSVIERDYLRVRYLTDLMSTTARATSVHGFEIPVPEGTPVTFIGLAEPEELPEGSQVYTLANLASLIPA
jgi:hypothetical protein